MSQYLLVGGLSEKVWKENEMTNEQKHELLDEMQNEMRSENKLETVSGMELERMSEMEIEISAEMTFESEEEAEKALEESQLSEAERYYVDCEREEREKREWEMAERRKFVEGMKRYPEMGIQVLINGKIPEEQDWERLAVMRDDNRFYMADFVFEDAEKRSGENAEVQMDHVAEPLGEYGDIKPTTVLKEIHWNLRYHGELKSQQADRKKRGKRKK